MADAQLSIAATGLDLIRYTDIPRQILNNDIPSDLRSTFFTDLDRIKGFYETYFKGAKFTTEGTKGDYVPAMLFYKKCRKLIDDESRFMFSNTPDISVAGVNARDTKEMAESLSIMNSYLEIVLKKNAFASKLIKAGKDCFIAGRVCLVVNFNVEDGIQIDFVAAPEFYYEYKNQELSRLIIFYHMNKAISKTAQRVKKKVYEMRDDGMCWVHESIYNGAGVLLEDTPEINTNFEFIPATIIFNDGLTGDIVGESEIDIIDEFESYYSKLANADKDTLRKSMNSIKYIIDGSRESTKDLGTGPGAIWDIQSDIEMQENGKASIGQIEPSMNYKDALTSTLDRVENAMYGMLSVPNITGEQLQGVITSGKTIRALYWPMTVRCNEKAKVWADALEFMVTTIFYGSSLVSDVVPLYTTDTLPEIEYKPVIEENYALPDDENEEKASDLQEVNALAMSRKAYMMKWRGLTSEEADDEIQQILYEKQLLEDGAFDSNAFGAAAANPFGPDEEDEEEPEEEEPSQEDNGSDSFGAPDKPTGEDDTEDAASKTKDAAEPEPQEEKESL